MTIVYLKEAQPKQPWLGVWNASAPGSACIQYDHGEYKIFGDEDCLYVNVYTPKVSDTSIEFINDHYFHRHFSFQKKKRNISF